MNAAIRKTGTASEFRRFCEIRACPPFAPQTTHGASGLWPHGDGNNAISPQRKLGVLGTISGINTPHSALVGIAVTPNLEIIFDTLKNSRKYPNLIARPACSFVIGWAGAQTVQYEGVAEELASPDLERHQDTYFKTWPDGPARLSWPGIVYFVVRPTWIRYSDFDQSPPWIEEFVPVIAGSRRTPD